MEFVQGLALDASGFITSLSVDMLTLIVLSTILFFIALRAGKSYIVGFILSSYIGALIFSFFPYGDKISFDVGLFLGKYDIVNIVILGITIGVIQVVLDYVLEIDFSRHRIRNIVSFIILSVSGSIALLNAAYITNSVTVLNTSQSFLDSIFTGEQTLFYVLLAPLIGVFLVTR